MFAEVAAGLIVTCGSTCHLPLKASANCRNMCCPVEFRIVRVAVKGGAHEDIFEYGALSCN